VRERLRRIPAEPVCFLAVAAAYLVHLFRSGYEQFYYDSLRYWELADLYERNGDFALLSYDFPFRGYSLPLLNYTLQEVASPFGLTDLTTVRLFGAAVAAALGVVILPRVARRLFPEASIGWGRVLALNALLFLYWRDHFDFPLSDFPALLAACAGLLGLLRGNSFGYLAAGIGFGLAANLRPAYVPALFLVVAAAALLPLRPWDWRRRGFAVTLVISGAFVVSLPQILINHRHHDSWSPTPVGARDIAMLQLTQGLKAQKYETYVGDPDVYPRPDVFFLDPATGDILDPGEQIESYGEYARTFFEHPTELSASYVRHVFNGLDVRYASPYVRDLHDSPVIVSLLLYLLLFVALARLLIPEARRRLGRVHWVGVAILISPVLTAIPGAVEPRFFLPVQVLVYMLVCFGPDYRGSLLRGNGARRASLAAACVAFVLVCLSLSRATEAQIMDPEAEAALKLRVDG
jgi:hypothetical protein